MPRVFRERRAARVQRVGPEAAKGGRVDGHELRHQIAPERGLRALGRLRGAPPPRGEARGERLRPAVAAAAAAARADDAAEQLSQLREGAHYAERCGRCRPCAERCGRQGWRRRLEHLDRNVVIVVVILREQFTAAGKPTTRLPRVVRTRVANPADLVLRATHPTGVEGDPVVEQRGHGVRVRVAPVIGPPRTALRGRIVARVRRGRVAAGRTVAVVRGTSAARRRPPHLVRVVAVVRHEQAHAADASAVAVRAGGIVVGVRVRPTGARRAHCIPTASTLPTAACAAAGRRHHAGRAGGRENPSRRRAVARAERAQRGRRRRTAYLAWTALRVAACLG